jgi:alkanesulfonate monooxygenase SsuD/methylene tetrahydromethanopterin reductase-like flavin-dependent oxidoreductase (luciferase family)
LEGKFYSFGPVKFEPKPVQKPHPPIVFGGETPAALRRAAALGDGWYGVNHSPESAAQRVGELRRLLAEAGRKDAPFEMTVSCGYPNLTREQVRAYAESGIDRIVVLPWQRGREAEEKLAVLAKAVLD